MCDFLPAIVQQKWAGRYSFPENLMFLFPSLTGMWTAQEQKARLASVAGEIQPNVILQQRRPGTV